MSVTKHSTQRLFTPILVSHVTLGASLDLPVLFHIPFRSSLCSLKEAEIALFYLLQLSSSYKMLFCILLSQTSFSPTHIPILDSYFHYIIYHMTLLTIAYLSFYLFYHVIFWPYDYYFY